MSADTRRRRLRFSLRSLLLLSTAVALWFGIVARSARTQRFVVEAIREAGGTVQYDFQRDEKGIISENSKPWAPAWLVEAMGEDYFGAVIRVELPSTKSAGSYYNVDALLTRMTPLQSFDDLTIDAVQLTDAGMETLRRFPNLKKLDIQSVRVTDDGIAKLNQLPSLEVLSLHCPRLTDAGMEHLSHLKHVESLTITGGNYTLAGAKHLTHMTALKSLKLDGSGSYPSFIERQLVNTVLKHSTERSIIEKLTINNFPAISREPAPLPTIPVAGDISSKSHGAVED